MVDVAIRGGLVVDGTGATPRRADVGITGARITEIGERVTGRDEIDASGRLVTPGFVDVHTHYDPQVLWDPWLTPSSWHGVTTVVAGNCGYSLAPARAENRETLLRTLDKVEDMRLTTLHAGVEWDFESYPDYLDAVARRGIGVNFGGYVGHTPVRVHVMGQDAYERPATEDEVDRMRAVVAESLLGGALGFCSDRAGFHLGDGGRPVPSVVATQDELEALMRVTAEVDRGIVAVAAGDDHRWLYPFQRSLGRTVNWNSILTYPADTAARMPYRDKLADHLAGRADGADVWVQVTCRPIAQEFSVAEPTSFYPVPAFAAIAAADAAGRRALYADPAWRAQAWADFESRRWINPRWPTVSVAVSPTAPQLVGRSVADVAAERGCTPFDVICDLAVADELASRFRITFANDDEDGVSLLLRSPGCILGLSDAGAHVNQICDAVQPTDFLAHWVRDRALMPVEEGIRKLTGELADVLHLDRGYLRAGAPADVLVLDYEALDPGPLTRVDDLPAGGQRLVGADPAGVDHILVNGVPTRRDGVGLHDRLADRPGQVLRSRAGCASVG